jgi:hypothetical protein
MIDHAAAKKKIHDILSLQINKKSVMLNVRKQNFIEGMPSNPGSTKHENEIEHLTLINVPKTVIN